MLRDRTLETDACLLIFDPHQDVAWMQEILRRESGRVSHVLLGGDFFDTHRSAGIATVEETCRFLARLSEEWGDRLTVLLGNHDLPYLEARSSLLRGIDPWRLHHACPGYTSEAAKMIADILPANFWEAARLFQVVNGYLVSHAGLCSRFWRDDLPVDEALISLAETCAIALERIAEVRLPILGCGRARGGSQLVGGIVWLDFNFEFSDAIPLPQLFGHTPARKGARREGRSWCLDGHQSCWAVVHRDGVLEIVDPRRPVQRLPKPLPVS